MAVRSEELINGRTREEIATPRTRNIPGGLLALAFGVSLWAIGAKYSLEGWVLGLNIVGDVLGLPADLPAPVGWWNLVCLPLGIGYSLVELRVRAKWQGWSNMKPFIATVFLMFLAHGTDIGSTILSALAPSQNAWPVAVWAAQAMWPAAVWGIFLTYLPEQLILLGKKMMK